MGNRLYFIVNEDLEHRRAWRNRKSFTLAASFLLSLMLRLSPKNLFIPKNLSKELPDNIDDIPIAYFLFLFFLTTHIILLGIHLKHVLFHAYFKVKI